MRARLTIPLPDRPARQFYLDVTRQYLIGRAPDCDVTIPDPQLSRHHARLQCREGVWRVNDLDSKNGVAIDGRAVNTGELAADAWLALGELMVRFELRSADQIDRDEANHRRRFETSLELRRALRPSSGVKRLMQKVLASVVSLAGAERGFVMLARADGELEVMCRRGVELSEMSAEQFGGSRGAIDRTLTSGSSVVVSDVQQFAALSQRPSVLAGEIRALVCVPLRVLDRIMGVIYVDSRETGKVFTELDLEILEGLADQAAVAIAVAQLDSEIVDLGSVLRDGVADQQQLARWRDRIPAYREDAGQGESGGPTWTQISAHDG